MSTKIQQENSAIVPAMPKSVSGGNVQVSAFTPAEMQQANGNLIQWFASKIELQKQEAAELMAAYEHAKRQKWKVATLQKHAALAEKRVTYFEKIKAALESGYYIVPNFPVTCFAIRTNAEKPNEDFKVHVGGLRPGWIHQQSSQVLPKGEGEYRNPFPDVAEYVDHHNDKGTAVWHSAAVGWEAIEFPFNMAKIDIMQATSRAMALKIFDDFGVLPGKSKKDDPMIIGRIYDPSPARYGERKHISLIIGWHFDTSIL